MPGARPQPLLASSSGGSGIPMSLRLATSDHPRTREADQRAFASLQSSAEQRALDTVDDMNLKLDFIEKLSEPNAPLSLLREALGVLDPISYDDLVVERHSVSELCPYPTCGNKPAVKWVEEDEIKPIKLKLKRDGGLYGVGSGGRGAFCSTVCASRSAWFRQMLGTGRTEMLEDVEQRRRDVMASVGSGEKEEGGEQDEEEAAPSSSTPTSTKPSFADNLVIHERATPTTIPQAPTASAVDFERPTPSTPNPTLSRARPTTSAPSAASSSLLPFDASNLARTVLKSSTRLQKDLPTHEAVPSELAIEGQPPPVWTSPSRMVNKGGAEVVWPEEEEDTEEIRKMMEEALNIRNEARERGEL